MPEPSSIGERSFSLFRVSLLIYAVRLVTGALIARRLGPTMMGIWIVLTLLPSYAEAFGRLKVDIAAVYVLGQKKYRLGEVCFALNLVALAANVVLLLLFVTAEPWLVRVLLGDANVTRPLVYLVFLTIPLHFISMNYAYLLIYLQDVRSYNAQNVLKTVLPGLITVGLMYAVGWGLGALITGLLVGSAAGMIYGLVRVHRLDRLVPTFEASLYRELVSFGGRLYVAGLLEQLNVYLAGLIVAVYTPAAQVAFFRMGQDRLQLLDQVPSAMNTVLYPEVAREERASARAALTAKACRTALLLLAGAGLAGGLLAWPLVFVLYGRAFLPMTFALWILLPGVIAAGASTPIVQYFMGTGEPAYVWRMALAALVMQAGLGLLLIPAFGYLGAALATSAAFVAYGFVRAGVFSRHSGVALREVLLPGTGDARLVRQFVVSRLRGWRTSAPAIQRV